MLKCFLIGKLSQNQEMINLIDQYLFLIPESLPSSSGSCLKLIMSMKPQVLFIDFDERNLISKSISLLTKFTVIIYISNSESNSFQAFEDNATDYLLFPIVKERFQKCVNKIVMSTLVGSHSELGRKKQLELFFINTNVLGKKEMLIHSNDIILIESIDNQIVITMQNGDEHTTFNTMKEMELGLPSYFMRIHKSFIINYKKVIAVQGTKVTLAGKIIRELPIGITFRKKFIDRKSELTIGKVALIDS